MRTTWMSPSERGEEAILVLQCDLQQILRCPVLSVVCKSHVLAYEHRIARVQHWILDPIPEEWPETQARVLETVAAAYDECELRAALQEISVAAERSQCVAHAGIDCNEGGSPWYERE
jgi:hypothetical protein